MTAVSYSEEGGVGWVGGFMAADEAEKVFADSLYWLPFLVHHAISRVAPVSRSVPVGR